LAIDGTQVKAIAAGQVLFSDWFKGYGLLVIVKHDKDYMSLYAYNQGLYQTKGDWVSAGDVLATVGKSGGARSTCTLF
jgi:septal ring factor EnvC (AmiA/AmiB activator)